MSVHHATIVNGVLHLENLPYPDGTIEVRLEPSRPDADRSEGRLPEWLARITLAEDDPSFAPPARPQAASVPVDLDGS